MTSQNTVSYGSVAEITEAIDRVVVETDIVLDIGCGIVPINYFRPKLHIMVEPFEEYRNILLQRHGDDKSVMIVNNGALETLRQFSDQSIDSVFLLDVIEHLDKDVGVAVIAELERVTRIQAVIFTPLGFMPQHMEHGEADAWGLSGAEVQEHRSGWTPDDFSSNWHFHICERYHTKNFRGEDLETAFGAFYAVLNQKVTKQVIAGEFPDIRRPLPSELELQRVGSELSAVRDELSAVRGELSALHGELEAAKKAIDAGQTLVTDGEAALAEKVSALVQQNEELADIRVQLATAVRERDRLQNLLPIRSYLGLRRLFGGHRSN